jgi:Histidine kinase
MRPELARPGVDTASRLDPPSPGIGLSGRTASGDDELSVRRIARRQWMRRRDLERQLHDGAALRISALALRLGLLRPGMADDEQEFQDAVERLQDELHIVLQELRDVAGQLYPPLLDEAGLGPALREFAGRSAVPLRVDASGERFGAAAEGAAYFTLLGCLAAQLGDTEPGGAEPGGIDVVVRRDDDNLVLLVFGVDPCHGSSMLDGVDLLGGTVDVSETASTGCGPIRVRIPCE